jgi:hypothetical protein
MILLQKTFVPSFTRDRKFHLAPAAQPGRLWVAESRRARLGAAVAVVRAASRRPYVREQWPAASGA